MPDDWDSYYKRCRKCGHIYHASEIGCPCEDEDEEEIALELARLDVIRAKLEINKARNA